jgi:hypothetical protein
MNNRIKLTLWIAGSLMLPLLFLTVAAAQVSPIKISLIASKTSYLASELIKMQINVFNDSGQDVICRKGYFGQDFHLRITFIDPDGKPINSKYLPVGKEPGPPYRLEDTNGVDRDAALAEIILSENPGDPNTYRIIVMDDAREFYDLSKAGRYTAQVFTALETFSDSKQDPDTGELFGFLDSAQSFTPSSNKISLEIASPAPGPLSVLVPNGGDVLPSGGTYAICWQAPSNAKNFDLKYSINNGTSWNFIKTVTGLNCTHWEEIPVLTANKKTCLMQVIGYDSNSVKVGEDISDKPFTIEVARVTSPNGGETLKSGNTWTIKWVTNKTVRPVAKTVLKYTINGGTTWKAIKTLTGNLGGYNWTVPSVLSTKTRCKIKVILKDASGVNVGADVSNKVFTIQP